MRGSAYCPVFQIDNFSCRPNCGRIRLQNHKDRGHSSMALLKSGKEYGIFNNLMDDNLLESKLDPWEMWDYRTWGPIGWQRSSAIT